MLLNRIESLRYELLDLSLYSSPMLQGLSLRMHLCMVAMALAVQDPSQPSFVAPSQANFVPTSQTIFAPIPVKQFVPATVPQATPCVDLLPVCPIWSQIGECDGTAREFVRTKCKASWSAVLCRAFVQLP